MSSIFLAVVVFLVSSFVVVGMLMWRHIEERRAGARTVMFRSYITKIDRRVDLFLKLAGSTSAVTSRNATRFIFIHLPRVLLDVGWSGYKKCDEQRSRLVVSFQKTRRKQVKQAQVSAYMQELRAKIPSHSFRQPVRQLRELRQEK